MSDEQDKGLNVEGSKHQRRLRGFLNHLIGYFLVMIVLVPINFFLTPEKAWFILPMVGWGSVLALHVAWVMGLFDIFLKR